MYCRRGHFHITGYLCMVEEIPDAKGRCLHKRLKVLQVRYGM
jgi:hypothetical protein